MNQGMPLSWGCTGKCLVKSATHRQFNTIKPCQINQEMEKNSVNQEYPWYFNFLSECMLHLPEFMPQCTHYLTAGAGKTGEALTRKDMGLVTFICQVLMRHSLIGMRHSSLDVYNFPFPWCPQELCCP